MTLTRVFLQASSAAAQTSYKQVAVRPGTVIESISWAHFNGLGATNYTRFAVYEGQETAIQGSETWKNLLWYKMEYAITAVGSNPTGGVERCKIPITRNWITLIIYSSVDLDEVFLSVVLNAPEQYDAGLQDRKGF